MQTQVDHAVTEVNNEIPKQLVEATHKVWLLYPTAVQYLAA